MGHYFAKVYGSFHTETEIMDIIKGRRNFKNPEILFIVDATMDFKAVSAKDLYFVARNTTQRKHFGKSTICQR